MALLYCGAILFLGGLTAALTDPPIRQVVILVGFFAAGTCFTLAVRHKKG